MATSTAVTSWAVAQFGPHAEEVARRTVQALTDAQQVGTRTQRASGQKRFYAYGATWSSKYEQMIYQFTKAAGGDLPPVEIVKVHSAPYDLVRVNGRLMIPFVLARALADVPDEPMLTSEILRAITARTVPAPTPPPTLFDTLDEVLYVPAAVPSPRTAAQATAPVPAWPEVPPVFIGLVCNAYSEPLLAAFWGTARSIDADTGRISWSPEPLPLQLAARSDGLRAVTEPRDAGAFDEGTVPEVAVIARPHSIAVDAPPADLDGDRRPDTAVGDVGE